MNSGLSEGALKFTRKSTACSADVSRDTRMVNEGYEVPFIFSVSVGSHGAFDLRSTRTRLVIG
eukprot:3219381-Pyramimonas_sp.AAC.1